MEPISAARALAYDVGVGQRTGAHTHAEAQVIYAESGVMRVTNPEDVWVAPPLRAVWVPPGVEHNVEMRTAVRNCWRRAAPDLKRRTAG